jgi:hypothetical protein
MKLPKVRDTLYCVVRRYGMLQTDPQAVHIIYVCLSLDRAQELRDNCEFEYQERGLVGFRFEVQSANYVDE